MIIEYTRSSADRIIENEYFTAYRWTKPKDTIIIHDLWDVIGKNSEENFDEIHRLLTVTQFNYGKNHSDGVDKPLDYEALTLCMRKINRIFAGKKIGMPKIGCGLAGGDWNTVEKIIKTELKNCNVTIVEYGK